MTMGGNFLAPVTTRFSKIARKDFWRLIAIAGCLHVCLVVLIYLVGRSGLLSDTFDRNGIGISFAVDSYSYRIEADQMAQLLHGGSIGRWFAFGSQFHVKLYSLSSAVFGPLLGVNILSNEPLNLLYYLLILGLVYALGKELFDRRRGLIAMSVVALWPSFLLHTTQMLRDPLFIAAMLLLFLTLAKWLTRTLSIYEGMIAALTAGVASLFLWISRGDMWEVSLVIILLGTGFFLLRQVKERRLRAGNMLSATLLLVIALLMPRIVPAYRQLEPSLIDEARPQRALLEESGTQLWSSLPVRISLLRHHFIRKYPQAGSNIDTEVELTGIKDIILYLPRALSIGLLAPFPNMWFVPGANVGLKGRVLSGMETLVIYLFVVMALIALWRGRSRLAIWLTGVIILVGSAALGYVVVNISTLYRMRYGFWMLVIILGADTLAHLPPFKYLKVEGNDRSSSSDLDAQPRNNSRFK